MNEPHTPKQPELSVDPWWDALLDEALAPPPAPAGLADRIVQATQPHLAQPARSAVVARIGWRAWGLAAAAAVLLLAGLLAPWVMQQPPASSVPAPASAVHAQANLIPLDQELRRLASVSYSDLTPLDEQIEWLSVQMDLAQAESVWPTDPMAEAVAEAELWQLTAEASYGVF